MGSIHASAMDIVEARVGSVLRDKWRVDRLIGVGGMAAVYAATHRNGNKVALKILHQQLSVDNNIRSRFRREGYVANMINHPGIVRVLDDDVTEEGSVFLVMDLLEGDTADARANRLGGRLPIEDVILVADGLLDVMAAAHAAGVVHRDIKPENVFITHEREVKVLDFGIARMRDGLAAGPGGTSGVKTAAMMGTPAFMPPEQALGRMQDVDAISDVWAVGATMFNLISGVLVHDAETANELLILAATATPRSLAVTAPDAPPALIEIIDRALAVEKNKRWSSARAMQHALRQAANDILRAPLPTPMSGRMAVQTAPAAFLPIAPPVVHEPIDAALDDTMLVRGDGEWNLQSGVSLSRSGDMRALLSPHGAAPPSSGALAALVSPTPVPHHSDTSTFHGMNAAIEPRGSSSRRVLIMAASASLLVALVGSVGVGVALRQGSSGATVPPAVATTPVDNANLTRATGAALAPPPPVVSAPLPAGTVETPAAGNADAPPAANDLSLDVDPTPSKPERSGSSSRSERHSSQSKSWLDRRK